VPHQKPRELRPSRPDCEQLGQLLRHAFPVGEGGSFTTVLESIRENKLNARR
jgi:hypothetical protein